MNGKRFVIPILCCSLSIWLNCAGTGGKIQPGVEIKVSKEATPDWVPNPPPETFVGISKNFTDESSARQDAVNDARKRIIDYLGLRINREIIDRILTQGKTDEIISADVLGEATTKMVGRTILKVRATKFHPERWQRTENEKITYYWKLFCLVPFSKSEHQNFAESWINQVLNLAKPIYNEAVQLEAANNLTSAALKYQQVIKILQQAEGIADFEPTLMNPIKKLNIETTTHLIEIKPLLLNNQISVGLEDLSRQLPHKPLRVAIGNINYEETPIGSKFSKYLADVLSVAFTRSPNFQIFDRDELDLILKEQGLALTGIIDEETRVIPGKLKGVEAILYGKYWNSPDQVKTNLFLTSVETGRIGATELIFPKLVFPEQMEFEPANLHSAIQTYNNFGGREGLDKNKTFKIRVWVDKANGGIYTEGEKVTIFFKANHDCFLKIYHTDSAGNILQLFPNQYSQDNFIKARRIYSIPDATSNFDFVVQPPFGSEIIKTIASLQPFPSDKVFEKDKVFKSLGRASQENIRGILTRDIGIKGRKGIAEDLCGFTTIE